jgi:hypothetical protein
LQCVSSNACVLKLFCCLSTVAEIWRSFSACTHTVRFLEKRLNLKRVYSKISMSSFVGMLPLSGALFSFGRGVAKSFAYDLTAFDEMFAATGNASYTEGEKTVRR